MQENHLNTQMNAIILQNNDKASCPFNAGRLDCPVKARQLLDYHPEIVPSVAVEKLDKR